MPDRFEDSATAYGYVRTVFDQVAGGTRPATVSITPSTRHVGVTRRDTFRPGFEDAVRAAGEMGYPVLVRSSGGGATAADGGTFGFSIIRPADETESGRGIRERYDEAAALVLGAFSRLGVLAEVGRLLGYRAEYPYPYADRGEEPSVAEGERVSASSGARRGAVGVTLIIVAFLVSFLVWQRIRQSRR